MSRFDARAPEQAPARNEIAAKAARKQSRSL